MKGKSQWWIFIMQKKNEVSVIWKGDDSAEKILDLPRGILSIKKIVD